MAAHKDNRVHYTVVPRSAYVGHFVPSWSLAPWTQKPDCDGRTTCGKTTSGMYLEHLTGDVNLVTCEQCLQNKRLPMDMLTRVEL